MSTDRSQPSSIPNLAGFVASTVGRSGEVHRAEGAMFVRSSIAVANGFVNATFVLDDDADPRRVLDEAFRFFGDHSTPFVLWAPQEDRRLIAEAELQGGVVDLTASPDMWIDRPVPVPDRLEVRRVESPEAFERCAALCEEGYDLAGMAWLMGHLEMLDAPGVTWAVAHDGDEALGAGCGFLDAGTGGIYYVATPARNARRGVAGAVTAWLVDDLLARGAASVGLQASAAGFPVYERLGFATRGQLERFTFT